MTTAAIEKLAASLLAIKRAGLILCGMATGVGLVGCSGDSGGCD